MGEAIYEKKWYTFSQYFVHSLPYWDVLTAHDQLKSLSITWARKNQRRKYGLWLLYMVNHHTLKILHLGAPFTVMKIMLVKLHLWSRELWYVHNIPLISGLCTRDKKKRTLKTCHKTSAGDCIHFSLSSVIPYRTKRHMLHPLYWSSRCSLPLECLLWILCRHC